MRERARKRRLNRNKEEENGKRETKWADLQAFQTARFSDRILKVRTGHY